MESNKQLKRLIAMQALCVQVEQDNEKIYALSEFLEEARKRQTELQDFYQDEWHDFLFDKDGEEKKDAEALGEALCKYIPEGHYSILGEDTIWNTIVDHRDALLKLLKTIVPMID
jgi:hypothetical protein